MPKRPTTYHRPQTLDEARKLLQQADSAPLAGGTRLLADDVEVGTVVDLQDLGLDGIRQEGGRLHVGAMTRLQDLHDAVEGAPAELLRRAIYLAGPNTYRHAATLGGVVGGREAESELLALLLVLDATINGGEISVADFLYSTDRRLITDLSLDWGAGHGALHRVGRTPADTPIVSVITWQPPDEDIRVGVVGAAPLPIRLPNIPPNELDEAIAEVEVSHPGDFRGSVSYRREMVGVLLRRAVLA